MVDLNAELEQLAQLADQNQGALHEAELALEKTTASFLAKFRRTGVGPALNALVNETNTCARLRVEHKVAEATAQIVRLSIAWLQGQLRQQELAIAVLRQTQDALLTHERTVSQRGSGHTEISLADPSLVDHFYRQYAGQPELRVAAIMADLGSPERWIKLKPTLLAQRIVASVADAFTPVLRLTVEEVLTLRFGDRSPQQWITRLEKQAAVAWNPDRAQIQSGGANLVTIVTIGVPDATQSLFASAGRTLVSTYDPERITALRTVYGGSFDALKPYAQWKRAYGALASTRLLHVYPNFQQAEVLSAQTFALALIYGLIRAQGAWYYYRSEDPLREAVRLANGLENAVTALRDRRDVQVEVTARLEAQMAQEGNDRTAARINGWVNNGNTNDPTLLKLRRAAREALNPKAR